MVGVLIIAMGVVAEIPSAGLSTGLIVAGGVVVAGGVAVTIYGSVDYSSNMKKYKAAAEKLAADQAEIVLHLPVHNWTPPSPTGKTCRQTSSGFPRLCNANAPASRGVLGDHTESCTSV